MQEARAWVAARRSSPPVPRSSLPPSLPPSLPLSFLSCLPAPHESLTPIHLHKLLQTRRQVLEGPGLG
jgi:hypothetical protein